MGMLVLHERRGEHLPEKEWLIRRKVENQMQCVCIIDRNILACFQDVTRDFLRLTFVVVQKRESSSLGGNLLHVLVHSLMECHSLWRPRRVTVIQVTFSLILVSAKWKGERKSLDDGFQKGMSNRVSGNHYFKSVWVWEYGVNPHQSLLSPFLLPYSWPNVMSPDQRVCHPSLESLSLQKFLLSSNSISFSHQTSSDDVIPSSSFPSSSHDSKTWRREERKRLLLISSHPRRKMPRLQFFLEKLSHLYL
jgi:hypothetical protein